MCVEWLLKFCDVNVTKQRRWLADVNCLPKCASQTPKQQEVWKWKRRRSQSKLKMKYDWQKNVSIILIIVYLLITLIAFMHVLSCSVSPATFSMNFWDSWIVCVLSCFFVVVIRRSRRWEYRNAPVRASVWSLWTQLLWKLWMEFHETL